MTLSLCDAGFSEATEETVFRPQIRLPGFRLYSERTCGSGALLHSFVLGALLGVAFDKLL